MNVIRSSDTVPAISNGWETDGSILWLSGCSLELVASSSPLTLVWWPTCSVPVRLVGLSCNELDSPGLVILIFQKIFSWF